MLQQVPPQIWQQQWLVWMPLVLTVLANLVVVLFGIVWNNRHIDSLRNEMGSLRNEMNGQIGGLRNEMGSLRSEMGSLRAEMIARIDNVRAEVAAHRAETRQNIAESEFRLMKEILELKGRVERLEEQRGLIQQR